MAKKGKLLSVKMSGRNIVAMLGFALLGVVVAGGFLFGMLFAFPKLKIGSMTAVDERNSQTKYIGPEIMEILTSRNFIIESENVEVCFWMRKEGQGAKTAEDLTAESRPEGSIVVEESATGLSFNSIKRTHIEWTRKPIGDEVYYRIKVLEPKGLIKRKTATIVYINLWRDSRVPEGTSTAPYNIVLQNGKSVVSFGGDAVDADAPEMLHINTLTVNSAGGVYLPVTPIGKTSALTVDIKNLKVASNNVPVDARVAISGAVDISGAGNAVTLSNIGSLNVTGSKNSVTVDNRVAGAVAWGTPERGVPAGSLNIRGACGNLGVYTENAGVDVASVMGGVTMTTVNGGLHVNEIVGGNLNFTATGNASVTVGAVDGAVTIPQMGVGAVAVSYVGSNVDIKSDRTNAGNVAVSFDPALTVNPTVDILGYDGNISVSNIRGATNITVRDWQNGTGRANIYAHFRRVDENVFISANTGYTNGHETEANITVALASPIWAVLDVIGTSYAVNELGGGTYIKNSYTNGLGSTFYLKNGDTIQFPEFINEGIFWNVVDAALGVQTHSHIIVRTTTRFYLK